MKSLLLLFFCTALAFSIAQTASADIFSSTNFQVLQPVIQPAGFSTSTNYRLFGTIGQIAIGTSSATNFGINAGFLYFPFITSPVVSATAGPQKVDLAWTAAEGFLGLTPASYTVGQSLISGGSYTYFSVGNVLSSSRTGLSSGVTYFFVVRALDPFDNVIATSSEVSAIPAAPIPPSDGGRIVPAAPSAGGGAAGPPPGTRITFRGKAYPLSAVTILKDGAIVLVTIAGPDANFSATVENLTAGNYTFGVYGEDSKKRRSSIFTFPVFITSGMSTEISGIFITPTIDVDKLEVRRGDNIAILGQSAPKAEIVIAVNSEEEIFARTKTDKDGAYLLNFDTSVLNIGEHAAKSKALLESLISSFGPSVGFKVGTKSVVKGVPATCPPKGDVNNDCRVNLVDFSIVAYWWNRPLTEAAKRDIDDKLWVDGKITLRDFSIMAYYWTG